MGCASLFCLVEKDKRYSQSLRKFLRGAWGLTRENRIIVILSTLTAVFLCFACLFAQAQPVTSFQPTDEFEVAANHSVIRFAYNGTYTQATLENGAWVFKNLHLQHFRTMEVVKISAIDCNLTVTTVTSNETFALLRIRYVVEGQGSQTVNFGVRPTGGDWMVFINNTFPALGDGWSAADDGTVTVTGARSGNNVTIAYYGYYDPTANLPFYERHSVALWTLGAVAIVVVVVAAIWWRNKKKSSTETKQSNRWRPKIQLKEEEDDLGN
jgi:hypothetical protein